MSEAERRILIEEAKRILEANRIAGYTVPCSQLYPFQWNWDAGFTCLGYSKFNLDHVVEEYRSLFAGQWKNGMIPHIIFHQERTGYFPNADFWEVNRFDHSNQQVKTSGITQPPVHGFILEQIKRQHPKDERASELVAELYPKILRYHEHLYHHRDPYDEGLVYIYHPWESGRDNSPIWNEVLEKFELSKEDIPNYQRVDNQIADPDHRPTDKDYDRFVYLLELGKKNGYQGQGIAAESPFLIQDTLFNAMLIRSNESLIELGTILGEDTTWLRETNQLSKKTFREKLWSDSQNTFVCYDLKNQQQLAYWEIGGLTALYAKIADQSQSEKMVTALRSFREGMHLVPSFNPNHMLFDPKRYWKGPVWPQMNWLIYHGLKEYDYFAEAEVVKKDLLSLIHQLGFYEYFDPRKKVTQELKKGYGGYDFSWTSAVLLDLIG